jgi:hypothetical protein
MALVKLLLARDFLLGRPLDISMQPKLILSNQISTETVTF